jgi:hypothetical protein
MPYGFNDDKSKYDLSKMLMGLILKRFSGNATTSQYGAINLGTLGISSQTDVPITIIAASGQFPNGLFAEVSVVNGNYWAIIKDNNGAKINTRSVTLYIYYLSSVTE